jgi:transcription elongation factor GreA
MSLVTKIKPLVKILFTPAGLEDIKRQQQKLIDQRPAAVEDLRKSREMGDLSENAYYRTSRAKLSSIDSQLRRFNRMIIAAKTVIPTSTEVISFGCFVTVALGSKHIKYQIVGSFEADPIGGTISYQSPLGKALLGHKVGDNIKVDAPSGPVNYQIVSIDLNS